MYPRERHRRMAVLLCTAAALIAGCSNRVERVVAPGTQPQLFVTLIQLPDPSPGVSAFRVDWSASSSGPAISHFVWALDPTSVDQVDAQWVRTTGAGYVFSISRRETHTFAVRAIDERGVMSDPWSMTFAAIANQPPSVRIVDPDPATGPAPVGGTVRVRWEGTDPDGPAAALTYRHRLFGTRNPDFPSISDFISFALSPVGRDSLRHLYAGYPGWNTVPGESTSVLLSQLVPGARYLFVITCSDAEGGEDPELSPIRNMLVLEAAGPRPTATR